MNKKYQNAAQRLHEFVSDDSALTDAEVRAELQAQGVDVEGFLARLAIDSGITAAESSKQPSTSERLRALASRAGSKMKKLLGDAGNVSALPGASVAYGRKGKPASKNDKNNGSSKRRK
jgi:hypothetical protein